MTTEQKNWAKQHDWFRCAMRDGECWFVSVEDAGIPGWVQFSDFRELSRWAGY